MNIQLFTQTWRTHWKSLLSWGAVLVAMNSIELYIYPTISQSSKAMQEFVDAFPDGLKKLFRMSEYFSGPGFLATELFSLIIPMVMIGVSLAWGSSATAEDEEKGSADLIFTLPIRRRSILLTRLLAAITALALLSAINFFNIYIGAHIVDLKVGTSNLAAATFSCFMMGVLYASLGTLLGALMGRKGLGIGAGAGFAILLYVLYTVSNLVTKFDFIKPYNPFEWVIGADQLVQGFSIFPNLKLFALSTILTLLATFIIERRDIHSI